MGFPFVPFPRMAVYLMNEYRRPPAVVQPIRLSRNSALLGLLLIAPVPSIGVWFAAFSSNPEFGRLVWSAAKLWLMTGPLVCWVAINRQKVRLPFFDYRGLIAGLLSAILLALVIIIAYWLFARPYVDFTALQSMLTGVGVDSVSKYLLLALYLTLVNSLMEEYVYRWFIYTQLAALIPKMAAVVCSAVIFTLHHTLVLSAYIPWGFNLLASLGVFTGGLIWSCLYARYYRIWPAYISHIGADIGVFVVGYLALY